MLWYHLKELVIGILLLMVFCLVCAGYAYIVNTRRPADDPKKRNYHPGAILLAPFTVPLLILGSVSIFILKALVYGVFLILFTVALVGIRKPFLLLWLDKMATKIGDKLLKANTFLIKLAFGPWMENPQAI